MRIKESIYIFTILMLISSKSYALTMSNHVIEHFKRTICQCSEDALKIEGEYKNNGYYVNLKDGIIKGYSFNNVIIKFEGLTEKSRNDLLDTGVGFSKLKQKCSIKVAADISQGEFQQIINNEIGRSSLAKRVFNQASFNFDSNKITVNGLINLKRVPGNPFALFSTDEFSPYSATISISITGSIINLSIIDGNINGQDMTPELKKVFLDWLNPLWDFSQLGFPCEIKEYKISPMGLRVVGTVF